MRPGIARALVAALAAGCGGADASDETIARAQAADELGRRRGVDMTRGPIRPG
jgi:hypothetical protein